MVALSVQVFGLRLVFIFACAAGSSIRRQEPTLVETDAASFADFLRTQAKQKALAINAPDVSWLSAHPRERHAPFSTRSHPGGHEEEGHHGTEELHHESHEEEGHHRPEEPHHETHGESHGESHGEEGGHEHKHGHEHEHEYEHPEEGALSLAVFLMLGFPALMVVFYLVNSPVVGIKVATWRVLNMTTSIFVAVMAYGAVKETIKHVFEPTTKGMIVITLCLFIFSFVGTHAVLFKLKGGDEIQLKAAATILAHISGFAAMYGFADAREIELSEALNERGLPAIIALILVSGTLIAVLAYGMDMVMNRVVSDDDEVTEEEERWIDVCQETDDDVFCLAISFLATLLIQMLIRGRGRPYEPGHVGHVTAKDTSILFTVSFGFALVVAGIAVAMNAAQESLTSPLAKRAMVNALHLSSMIMAWCFLFWAEWQIYQWGWDHTIMGGCLVVATFMTFFSFFFVFILQEIAGKMRGSNKMTHRAMNSIELALGVLVGFSWERAFDVGFEEIEQELHANHEQHCGLWVLLMSLVLVAIVAPAWRLYMLPKALQMEEVGKRHSLALEDGDA